MLKKGIVLALLLVLISSISHAAGSGTAYGQMIGSPSCSGLGTDRTCILGLSAPGVDVNSYTAVYCQYPYDTICEQIQINETVIVDFTLERFGATCVGHFFYEPYYQGGHLSHYCYPGPCGS